MSTLEKVFQPILLDCSAFGLDGSGDINSDTDDLAAYLPNLAKDFSFQVTVQAINHLRILRKANSGDFDSLQIEALLERALFRLVPQADLEAIVKGSTSFHSPVPIAAVTTDAKELDFPLKHEGTRISSLSATVKSAWREEVGDRLKIQLTHGKIPREEVWSNIFQHFVFGPYIKITDPYLLIDLHRCYERGLKFSLNSGFGYFLKKIQDEVIVSSKHESEFCPRSVHVLTSGFTNYENAKSFQSYFVDILKTAIDEVAPSFAVEVTVTDEKENNRKVLHQRVFAVSRSARFCRVLLSDNSIGSFFGKHSFDTPINFAFSADPKVCELQATIWTSLTNKWRTKGFHYKWTNPSALT
jgi:hypothetical protein